MPSATTRFNMSTHMSVYVKDTKYRQDSEVSDFMADRRFCHQGED